MFFKTKKVFLIKQIIEYNSGAKTAHIIKIVSKENKAKKLVEDLVTGTKGRLDFVIIGLDITSIKFEIVTYDLD